MFILLMVTTIGCKPGVPSKYIQPNEMEEILYDYHLAGAMARNNMGDGKTEYAYRLAALKKHGVDQAKFDSSMVYYMQNTNAFQKDLKQKNLLLVVRLPITTVLHPKATLLMCGMVTVLWY